MQENTEIEHLFSNIQKSLKVYTLKELNNTFKDIIDSKNNNSTDVSYALNIVCEHFKINSQQLMGKDNRGVIIDAKQIAYCLLYYEMNLSVKFISKNIFKNWRNSVYRGINRLKKLNINVKEDLTFSQNYTAIQSKLFKHKNKIK
jgi:chromosomal replication initiation ATPase DnaA